MTTPVSRPPLALVGPTASGKSAVSMVLAQHFPLEIISVDSALVYRGMDIGTAKPSAAELATVPHHLIDIRDPSQAYSAAEFAADAKRLIADIQARGRYPLLVGGTMLYLKALLQPLDDMPAAQPALRAAIEAHAQTQGWPALHAQLAAVDPVTAQRLNPNDSQRIGRALEVWQATGKPLSSFHTGQGPADVTMPVISLEPTDRAWLHARIAQRFDQMLAQGLVAEVHALMQRHRLPPYPEPLDPDLPSMRCVGYRQVWEVLSLCLSEQIPEQTPAVKPYEIRKIRETGIAATRQLAKRQLTWLRSVPDRLVEPCDAPGLSERVLARVRAIWTPQ